MTVLDRDSAVLFPTYRRLPLAITRAEGLYLITDDGSRYLDMVGGIAVNALGYGHPAVLGAVNEQAQRYIHLSNYFAQEPQLRLAELLTRATGLPRAFFANSGTETVEGALKLARRWGAAHGRTEILSFTGAFHGRTFGALSLMDRTSYREGFGPFLDGFRTIEFNDAAALQASVSRHTAAVVVECIQGEGGIRPLSREFTARLDSLHRTEGFLLVADEIQSGAGRTGTFCAYEQFGLRPDVVLLAKPVGGGLPLGVILATEEASGILQPGTHGTTFGGNPVACAAGYAAVREILDRDLMDNARSMGARLCDGLRDIASRLPHLVREVRGYGLMAGMELHREGDPVVTAARNRYVIINCTDRTVLRFLPPLIVEAAHIDTALAALEDALVEVAGPGA